MKLEVNGQEYELFTSASAELRLDALSNTFSFEATSSEGTPLPFRGGEKCRVIVDNEPVLTGFIEVVDVSYSSNLHSIFILGRDKTGDLLDSTLNSIEDIRGQSLTLKGLIEKIIAELNLDIRVLDNVNPKPFNAAEDIASPEPGQNAFEFLEKYARKRQVLLTSSVGNSDILITQSEGTLISNAFIHNLINSNSNNVLEGRVSYDTTGRYNLYKFASSMNFLALNLAGESSITEAIDQKGEIVDPGVRSGRQLVLVSSNPSSDAENGLRAQWEANIRKARGRVYSVTLDGFRNQAGSLWGTNTVVQVIDQFAGINAEMLINTVTFSFSDEGRFTTLSLVEKNAYTLELTEPAVQEVASGLFG